jgi:hypothetical protein
VPNASSEIIQWQPPTLTVFNTSRAQWNAAFALQATTPTALRIDYVGTETNYAILSQRMVLEVVRAVAQPIPSSLAAAF